MKLSSYVTLIGQDTQIAQNKFTASVAVTVSPELASELLIAGIQLTQDYAGGAGGVNLTAAGTLYFFNADPAIAAGTAIDGLTAAQVAKIVSQQAVVAGDWVDLATTLTSYAHIGAVQLGAATGELKLPYLSTVWVAFLYTGATTFNSAAGDQEVLKIRLLYK